MLDPNITNFVDLLKYRATHTPNKTAYIFLENGETEQARITYKQLHEQSQTIAAALLAQATPGDRALLLYPSGIDFITTFFACLTAGIIAVPVYPPRRNQSLTRLQSITQDATPTLALTTQKVLTDTQKSWETNPLSPNLKWIATDNPDTLLSENAKDEQLRSRFNLDHTQKQSIVKRSNSDQLRGLSGAEAQIQPAFLQYTSGSTGTPKGVIVTHANLIHNSRTIYTCFNSSPDHIGVSWLPFHHDMGLIGGVLQTVYGGGTVVLMSPVAFLQKPLRWLQAISRYKAVTSGGPNFGYDLCAQTIKPDQLQTLDLSTWTLAFTGAEPIRPETLDKFTTTFEPCGFSRSTFYPCYGMAETTLLVTGGDRTKQPVIYTVNRTALERNQIAASSNPAENKALIGCGHSWLDQKVSIVDPDTQTLCPPNKIGEIWVSGGSIAKGYWQRPEQTEETFQAHIAGNNEGPFLRTGDLGFLTGDELFITGRLKDVIIIRGRNHYPQDIELTVETAHEALQSNSCAAFSVDLESAEQLVVVQEVKRPYLRTLSDPALTQEIILSIRRALSETHELQLYAVVLLKPGSLPKTSSGKVQRKQCRKSFLEETLNPVAEWTRQLQTETPELDQSFAVNLESLPNEQEKIQAVETWLTQRIAQRVQISPTDIDRQEPLASYGLNSLQVIEMSTELEAWLGRTVLPTIVYDFPTIAALATQLIIEETNTTESKHYPTASRFKGNDEIAVVGIGCRFPGAQNIQAFWRLLHEGQDAITEVPLSRWDVDDTQAAATQAARWGGFLKQIDQFDPKFFGISPREAVHMDPQQRLLLEVCWETLENAGIAADQLAGSQSGIFLGVSNGDYSRLQGPQLNTDVYYGTGNAFSIAANRLSYLFDWHGPSFAVDTACSSSLVAVHQACNSLLTGECNFALAGGVNLILSPQLTVTFSQAQMMAADGRCKTFDASADGYVRSEGCGIVALKRLSAATADGDTVLGIIKGSAINQDGRSNGLTAPNSLAQQSVIRQALSNAGIGAQEVDYIEAHGTGTALGDPIEVNSLKAVFTASRTEDCPCWLGSVKTNIGHLEPAAGIAGLIKVLLALQHEEIPAHLHLKKVNPYIQLNNSPLEIVTEQQPWVATKQARIAGVSAFGFGGTNAHVIVSEAAQPASEIATSDSQTPADEASLPLKQRPLQLLTLSAKSEAALQALVMQYQDWLTADNKNITTLLGDICFTANAGRSHFSHRIALIASSTDQLQTQLQSITDQSTGANIFTGAAPNQRPPKIAFIFTGQGAQYFEMGQELYATHPIFRTELNRCADVLKNYDIDLLKVLYQENNNTLDQTAYTQPALFAIEYALAQLWKSWGIKPEAVLGHSVGEYAAACIAGIFSLEDGLELIAERGRLMQALPPGGEMLSLLATVEQTQQWIEPYAQRVSIAASNGPSSVVISGEGEALSAIARTLTEQNIKHKKLTVSHAFHSPLMEPVLADFQSVAQTVSYTAPTIPFISCLTGKEITDAIATPDYWIQHIQQPVKFADGIHTLHQKGYQILLEVGPKPLLLGMAKQCLSPTTDKLKDKARYLPSLRPDQSNWQQMLASLSQLYTAGIAIDWTAFSQDYSHKKVLLPTYPFQRQRYWVEPADTSEPRPKSLAASQNGHPLLGQKLISPVPPTQFQNQVSVDCPHYLTDHRVFGQAILPATAYVEIALAAVSRGNNQSITLTDFDIQRGLILAEDSPVTLQTILAEQNDGTHQFKIFSLAESDSKKTPEEKAPEEKAPQWICHAQGTLETTESPLPAAVDLEAQKANFLQPIPVETYYQKLRDRGLEYGQNFQAIQQLWSAPNQALAEIHLPDILEDLPYRLHPVLLDASFQTLAAAIGEASTTHTYLPTQIEQLTLYAPIPRQVWAIGSLSPNPQNPKQLIGTLQLTDAAGNLLAKVKGLILKQTNKELLLRFLRPALPPSLYQLRWKKAPLVSAPLPILPTEPENWLIFTTETVSEISAQLIEQLQQQGHNCILVSPATRYHSENEHTYQLDPTNPEDFHQLLQSLDSQHSAIKGIVQLWGIPPEPSDPASKQNTGCTATLHLVQALSKARIASNLWILTQGAQLIAGTSTNQSIAQVQQSTLWGLGRVIALEHPELKCKRIDLSPDNNQPPQLIQELLTPDAEDQIAYRNNDRYIARLDSYDPTQPAEGSALTIPASPFQLKLTEYGLIDNLALQPIQRRSPAPHDVEIQVSAAGLNFRDVLNVLGLLKDYYAENLGITHANQLTFGFECAGTIVAKGDQVSHLQIGDNVIATMLTDGVSRFVTTRSEFVIPKPAHITFAEAATLPLAFLTAYYGLHHLARLQPGDKVLIHAAAGGVGQAAVQIAQKAGAEIFATASPAKWDFLKEQGIAHIMNSRNLDFAAEVMALTEGKGVDVVLNSLNGEYIDKSFEALASDGRFVELGKIGIWERDRVSSTYPGAHYFPFDLGEVTKANPTLIRDLWLELSTHFQQKHFRPLPIKTFPIQSSIQAFRHMQQAKHIGKVILTLPNEQNRTAIDPNSNYLITGGLGALGLKVAQWIANQGAAHITLTGRSTPSTQAISAIEEIKSIGTEISILLGDISNQQDVHSIFQQLKTEDFPPLKGIIHAAGVLQDGLLSQLTWAEFEKVMAPKVQGTWHLHHLTESLPLDFFVCFSSIASLLGSPGQSNYSAANAFADALMQYRRAHNLPGLSINWGPWANVGMAAQQDTSIQDRLQARGVNPLTPEQALEILEQLLTPHSQPSAQVGAFSIDWPKFTAQLPPGVSPPVLEQFKLAADDTQGDRLKGLEQLKQIPTAQRREHLMHHIQAEIADVLGYDSPEEIALDQPLGDLGVDSLMAVELANQLEYNLGPTIPASFLFEHPTLEGLVEYLIEQMPEIEF